MTALRILYNGWPLCHEPTSPAALHLLALLAYLPKSLHPLLAVPEPPPPWLPPHLDVHVVPTSAQARIAWEQQTLPHLRQKLNADLLHLTTETASLLNGTRTLISPTQPGEFDPVRGEPRGGLLTRLRGALAAGGTARAQAVIWPNDLPPRAGQEVYPLPPIVHPAFIPDKPSAPSLPGVDLPEAYVLYHGPEDEASLRRVLNAWTWVAGPVGQQYPLLMLGLSKSAAQFVETVARALKIEDTLRVLPHVLPTSLPLLYQGASVVFHPVGVSAWGGAIRHALACGTPVVAAETAWTSAMVGPAAILVEPNDTRRLGASIIGILVKENLAERLQDAGAAWAADWTHPRWGEKLNAVYSEILDSA
ncbi:MAG: glycosyltransferase [Anaerolineales bacterium]|nr:glycosyltransferase [Anaerolineales bacterium]